MRIAAYHCLAPGGARRMLEQVLVRVGGLHDVELFELDLGPRRPRERRCGRPSGEAGTDTRLGDLSGALKPPHVVPVPGPQVGGVLRPAVDVARVVAAEARVAGMIDGGGFDLVFANPSQFTQAPSVLYRLRTPSVYMIQEPRRRSFEAGYRTTMATGGRGPAAVTRTAGTTLFDRVVGGLDRRAVAAADTLVCNSYFSAESVARAYGREARVCHLGVDTETFSLADAVDGAVPVGSVARDRPFVLSVGALDPTKGHDLVVEALGLVDEKVRPALDVVYERGAPGYDDALRHQARGTGVELRLHEHISDRELVGLYRGASATVGAARLEPFGLTPLESMACGTPVVAVREGGYRETVSDGVNGELVERRPDALAAAIARQVARAHDPAAIRATVVPAWGWDRTVACLLQIFDQAANPPAPARR